MKKVFNIHEGQIHITKMRTRATKQIINYKNDTCMKDSIVMRVQLKGKTFPISYDLGFFHFNNIATFTYVIDL